MATKQPTQSAEEVPVFTEEQEKAINAIVSLRLMELVNDLVARGQLPPHPTVPGSAAIGYARVETALLHARRMVGDEFGG